jgi:hypothetical protein
VVLDGDLDGIVHKLSFFLREEYDANPDTLYAGERDGYWWDW